MRNRQCRGRCIAIGIGNRISELVHSTWWYSVCISIVGIATIGIKRQVTILTIDYVTDKQRISRRTFVSAANSRYRRTVSSQCVVKQHTLGCRNV